MGAKEEFSFRPPLKRVKKLYWGCAQMEMIEHAPWLRAYQLQKLRGRAYLLICPVSLGTCKGRRVLGAKTGIQTYSQRYTLELLIKGPGRAGKKFRDAGLLGKNERCSPCFEL